MDVSTCPAIVHALHEKQYSCAIGRCNSPHSLHVAYTFTVFRASTEHVCSLHAACSHSLRVGAELPCPPNTTPCYDIPQCLMTYNVVCVVSMVLLLLLALFVGDICICVLQAAPCLVERGW